MPGWCVIEGRYIGRDWSDVLRPVGLVEGKARAEAIAEKLKWRFERARFFVRLVDEYERVVIQDEINHYSEATDRRGRALAYAADMVIQWDKKLPAEPETSDPIATVQPLPHDELLQSKVNSADGSEANPTAAMLRPKRSTERGEGRNDDQAAHRLLSLFTNGLADERFDEAASVLRDDKLTTNEKLTDPTPKPRGRRKADYATVQREAELAADWKRASETGIYKADFAKQKRLKVKDLDALLDRVAWRKRNPE